jgi:hypothetical protein
MATFIYNTKLELTPRPGVKYATVYIKQSRSEHERLRQWLIEIGTEILAVCELDPQVEQWFSTPLMNFKKSRRGEYYTAQDLLTDMIEQLTLGRDMPESMLNRWNRLCDSTAWEIEMIPGTEDTHLATQPLV